MRFFSYDTTTFLVDEKEENFILNNECRLGFQTLNEGLILAPVFLLPVRCEDVVVHANVYKAGLVDVFMHIYTRLLPMP